jgi:molybdopterin-dependent oxidoreductase alpha subunit
MLLDDIGHGAISLEPADPDQRLTQTRVAKKATGISAVLNSFKFSITQANVRRGTLPLLQVNQNGGFDCPGCAWPDPDKKRSAFEFCENGAKAIAHESDSRKADPAFFEKYSIAQLSSHSDYWLEQQGRLTHPMILDEGAKHYRPISWDDALTRIADQLRSLDWPDQAAFYTSGKATNEAAFALQVMVRNYGTNNLPDCSNMCHESSGRALTKMFGLGKGTVTLDDFEKAKLILVVGQNPGTNHPRQLTALQEAKRAGAKIISVNPLPEAGLMGFMNPQEPAGLLGVATKLTDLFLQVNVNGDIALFKGILKQLVAWDDAQTGSAIDWDFVKQYTQDIDPTLAEVRVASWEKIVHESGISRDQIELAASWIRDTDRIIICWCLGVTQHRNGTQSIQEMMNVLLMRGAIGKPGAGACPVRGHSNVQGDRTMGVWEKIKPEMAANLKAAFNFDPPLDDGYDSQQTALALHRGDIRVFLSLGGNFLMAMSDTRFIAEGIRKTDLSVRIGTKLNRADLVTGQTAILLPCLGRTEADERHVQASDNKRSLARPQWTSCENSMGVVQSTRGKFAPASPHLKGEVEILCRLAAKLLHGRTQIDWAAWADDYNLIRDGIAKVIPGCEGYNERAQQDGGFYLPNGPRVRNFTTPTGKAHFTVNEFPQMTTPPGQLSMTTVRSHDQFNTTIYGLDDRYRGILRDRRVIMMHADDMAGLGIDPHDRVHITSHAADGSLRRLENYTAILYPVPRRCVVMYYPEANTLIPIDATDASSNCPSFKQTFISVVKA